jgi:hypothetical protein
MNDLNRVLAEKARLKGLVYIPSLHLAARLRGPTMAGYKVEAFALDGSALTLNRQTAEYVKDTLIYWEFHNGFALARAAAKSSKPAKERVAA